jgi:uncharacterized damage-inducible protein DinB
VVVGLGDAFTRKSRELLAQDYLPKIERSIGGLNDDDIWWRPNAASNSIGNLMLHLRGNVAMWIVGGVGGRPFKRDRDREFDERRPIVRGELLARLQAVTSEAAEIIGALDDRRLLDVTQIQGYEVTILEAVYHVVEHFGMHTGQIILLAKARLGHDLALWTPRPPPP